MKKFTVFFLAGMLFLLTDYMSAQTPVETNGQLQVIGVQLSNEYGYPVQLRGMSSHGLQWYGDCVNATTIGQLKEDWGADIVRLAMYVDENSSGYLASSADTWKATVKEKADLVISAGLYCIIDWHVHNPGDPLIYVDEAIDFFDYFSELYADVPNVIFEICNEPNKVGDDNDEWDDNMWTNHVKPFAEQIIPTIKANSPNAIILVGNPIWSSKPGDVVDDPLTDTENILYSFHFYGGSHYTQSYINQYSDKIPIFMDEWGTSINKGNYGNDYDNTQEWFDLMNGNNPGTQLMSWCNWSLCDKSESSAALASGACNSNANLTSESGAFVKEEMLTDDNFIAGAVSTPVFAVHPFAQTVGAGTTAYLRCKAVGPGTMEYQWYKDGSEISGAADSILIVSDFSSTDAGIYKVKAENYVGAVMSKSVEVSLSAQATQDGTPWSLPGVIEIENYDDGGAGISYNDLEHPNTSEAAEYSSPAVEEIYVTDGDDDGDALGGLAYNDWVEYTVTFEESGNYTFVAHAYSEEEEPELPQFWVALDGVKITKIKDIETTYSWSDTYSDTVWVDAGTYVMQVLIEERFGLNSFETFLFDNLTAVKLDIDCNGEEGGTASYDSCGICSGGSTGITPSEDSDGDGVYDCDDSCPDDPDKTEPGICGCGIAEGECEDCNGEYGGTAEIDECGVCSGGTTGIEPNESCVDCAGIVDGTASIDNCGVCSGGTTGIEPNESCTDCQGVLNGEAEIDDCGVCSGGNTGIEPNSTCVICDDDEEADECGVCGGDGSSCEGTQMPYQGIIRYIPGTIQAEDFDAGGADVAYYDTDSDNNGTSDYRDEGVDLDDEGDDNHSLAYIAYGEYLNYTVEALYTGNYTVKVGVGCPSDGNYIELMLDDTLFAKELTVTNTGAYHTFEYISVENIYITKGEHEIRLLLYGSGFNLDDLVFDAEFEVDCNGDVDGTAYYDSCSICVGGNTGLTDSEDSDGDGVYDCSDLCPDDPDKVYPGDCGCGVAEGECEDCNGDIGGGASIDDCGVCSGGNTGIEPNSTCTDCNLVLNGEASIDDCGVCSGGTTGIEPNETCSDCNGVVNGSASIDDCGVCSGGTTGVEPNSTCIVCDDGSEADECGVCGGDGSSCDSVQMPYQGVIRTIPGEVEAEDYDTGGEGLGYHDSGTDHQGTSDYRDEGVDLDDEGDDNHSIAYITDGEYLNYTMEVLYTGYYTVSVGVGCPNDGNSVDLMVDEETFADDLTVTNTGGYHVFEYTTVENVYFTEGTHEIRLYLNGSGFNVDDFVFEAEFEVDCNGDVDGTAYYDDCEICVGGNTGLTACGQMTLNLGVGWNLISFYYKPADTTIATVFANVMSGVEQIKSDEGYYRPELDEVFQSLNGIEIGEGYLVQMANTATITVEGNPVLSADINLKEGWNLIGFPLTDTTDIATSVSDIADYVDEIKNFDGAWTPDGTQTITDFEPGKGYFIYVNQACVLSF